MTPSELTKIMFLDIETVPQTANLRELPSEISHLWEEKYELLSKRMPEKYDENSDAQSAYESNAGIYAEFGKIICISVGFIHYIDNQTHFRTKSFSSDNEKELLENFNNLIMKFCTSKEHTVCGHNIKEFDIPYLCRRMLVNNIQLPPILQIAGKKPWEINFMDTLELWKFGDYKNFTALKLLTALFGIPTPKDDIDGSKVAEVYYKEKNLQRISFYCQKDVVATAQVFLKLNGISLIPESNIQFLN